ncbi:MAG: type II CAAX endopeptidase family protein [Agathobacter sp.]|nr:type II CAAX endopeptidase family protein [Agathobacter sp.]
METLKQTKQHFSKLGLMYFLGSIIIIGIQYLEYFIISNFFPKILDNYTAYFLILMLSMYAISMPLMGLLIRTVPKEPSPEKKKMTMGQWIITFIICYAGMYLANIFGNIITAIISAVKGSAVSNDFLNIATSNNVWCNLFIMVLLAPIAEELLFRKFLIDRTAKYGEGISVLFSALFFGLLHGNLNQFAYAFVIGGIFAFIYVKTRNVKYTIFMHMLVNFLGSIASLALLKLSGFSEIMSGADMSQERIMEITMNHLPGMLLFFLYVFLIIGLVIAGIVLFCVNFKKIHFRKTEYSVPEGKRFATYFVNIGVLVYTIYWIIRIILQLFS